MSTTDSMEETPRAAKKPREPILLYVYVFDPDDPDTIATSEQLKRNADLNIEFTKLKAEALLILEESDPSEK